MEWTYPLIPFVVIGIIAWIHNRWYTGRLRRAGVQPPQRSRQRTPAVQEVAPRAQAPAAAAAVELSLAPVTEWWTKVQDEPQRTPHAAVLGPSGEGKSVLMEALARSRQGELLVIQPNRDPSKGEWEGCPVLECDDDGGFATIEAALKAWRAEFTRRGGAMKRSEPMEWFTLALDEVPLLVRRLKDLVPDLIVDGLSAGRPRKMRLILGSTNERVGALGIEGYGDLLDSCAVFRLGAFAVATVKDLEGAPFPATLELRGKPQPIDRTSLLAILKQVRSAPAATPWTPDATPQDSEQPAAPAGPPPISVLATRISDYLDSLDGEPLMQLFQGHLSMGDVTTALKLDAQGADFRAFRAALDELGVLGHERALRLLQRARKKKPLLQEVAES